MKLRHLFILTFCLITIIPMALFWIWPYSKALESEIKDVKERHLVIAKNLSATFERYYNDVVGIFSIIDIQSNNQLHSKEFKKLLQSYEFNLIVLIDDEGKVKDCLFDSNISCPKKIDNNILKLAKRTIKKDEIKISTVTKDESINSEPMFLVVKEEKKNILLAYLSTKYIVKMGKRVAFGEKGHAAIVDHEGNVLAHPLDSWIKDRKSLIKVSAVQKMLEGKTGVEKFYSPALKGDMIAGYTHVPNANWGVMVPQPIVELENKAKEIDETAIFVMLLGVALALLITIPVSFILVKPLEMLSNTIKLIEKGSSNIDFKLNISKIIPLEIRDLNKSFSDMMNKIEEKKAEITKLAYFDSNTKLPNRNYFYELSNKALNKMLEENKKAALIFIDFDEFKLVNDTYGHRAGDELLYLFGKRISQYFSLDIKDSEELYFYEALPEIIPARLAGDEFVILLLDVKNKDDIEEKIKSLFKEVFSKYDLYGGIELNLSGSAGVALFPEHGQKYSELLKHADIAMYDAKAEGKNRIKFSKNIDS